MFRLKRTDIPGVPDAVRVSVELADEPTPTPAVEVSPDAISAAALGPAPLTDAALIQQQQQIIAAKDRTIAHLTQQLAERSCAGADTDARLIEARRQIDAKDKYLWQLQRELAEERLRLQKTEGRIGDTAAIAADRDRLDAANGVLVERIRDLEKRLAAARSEPGL